MVGLILYLFMSFRSPLSSSSLVSVYQSVAISSALRKLCKVFVISGNKVCVILSQDIYDLNTLIFLIQFRNTLIIITSLFKHK